MSLNYNVTIDGEAGTGKSSASKAVAKKLGLTHVNSGSLYRLIAYKLVELYGDISITDLDKNIQVTQQYFKTFEIILQKNGTFAVKGENLDEAILNNDEWGSKASLYSGKEYIRDIANNHLIKIGKENKGILMEGRDIGTIVMPDAKYKFFLTASEIVKAKRRQLQMAEVGIYVEFEKLLIEMASRDMADRGRKIAPTKQADDAIVVDTSELTFDQVVNLIYEKILELEKAA